MPAGVAGAELRNQLGESTQSGGNPQLTVWDASRRQWIPAADAFGAGNTDRLIGPLGEVWVRASGQMFPFEYAGRTVAGRALDLDHFSAQIGEGLRAPRPGQHPGKIEDTDAGERHRRALERSFAHAEIVREPG